MIRSIFILVFSLGIFSFKMEERKMIVQFEKDDEETRKLLGSVSSKRLTFGHFNCKSELDSFLVESFPNIRVNGPFHVDVVTERGSFQRVTEHNFSELFVNKLKTFHISIRCDLTPKLDNCSHQLAIAGRAFDTSNGIMILDRKLHVWEPAAHISSTASQLGTGLNTWDGAVVLAKYLESNSFIVKDKNVLEVGAGTGVVGMAAACLGASQVTNET